MTKIAVSTLRSVVAFQLRCQSGDRPYIECFEKNHHQNAGSRELFHVKHHISVGGPRLFSASSSRTELCLARVGGRQSMWLSGRGTSPDTLWNPQFFVNCWDIWVGYLEISRFLPFLENEFYVPQHFNDRNVARKT